MKWNINSMKKTSEEEYVLIFLFRYAWHIQNINSVSSSFKKKSDSNLDISIQFSFKASSCQEDP